MEEFLEPVGGDLIIVRQLPVIEDRLEEALESIQDRLDSVSGLVATEDNYKEVKKIRASLNKEFKHLEKLKSEVKKSVEAPYKKFESGAYKRMADAYKDAISQLDKTVKEVENSMKSEQQNKLFMYYEDYRQSLGLDSGIAGFQRANISVGLSDSLKALKEEAKAFLDGIYSDLKMIGTLEDRDEVYAEYRMSLNVSDAVRTVNERHKQIEELRKNREAEEEARRLREEQEAAIDAAIAETAEQVESVSEKEYLSSPTVQAVEESEELSEEILHAAYLKYDIYGTLTQLKGMKAAMIDCMIEYCERNGMKYGKSE